MVLETLVANLPTAGIAAIFAGLLRNVAGWLENALKDGKIDKYEKKKLVGTIIKYFGSINLLMFGLPAGEAVALAFSLDVTTSAIKSAIKPARKR